MKKLLIGLLLLIVVVVAVGLATPKNYTLAKTITINAPPEAVHAYAGELTKWPEWAPWYEMDPTIETTLEGQSTGVGAHQHWTGEDGDGELTFTKCDPATGIAYDMAFISGETRIPATSAMTYKKVGDATEVTWSMEGTWKGAVPPVMDGWMKLLTPFTIGSAFDSGLGNLKESVEGTKSE